ncbi:hypothetical protein PV08_03036 [Exophiala spinifera]|uniref:Glutathione S-transferase n=1 Tax=Exophiala spinifera TaxID=91928 RepID=A0A0D2A196_9EURO|nr:uncharacterized protein PV08_03036 [Exophiala spinifera]KIW18747.1 hypothetical protein PV08_03036 [Exophiala spinifera]
MPPSLTVHHLRVSQSERIVWLCEELQIPYTLKCYDRSPLLAPPALASLTPMQSAPVITDTTPATGEEFNMTESGAIAEYILSVYGGGGGGGGGDDSGGAGAGTNNLSLTPTHRDFHSYLFWFHFANGTLMPALGRRMFVRLADPTLTSDAAHAWAEAALAKALTAMDDRLAATGAWLAGADFTAADVMNVFCVTTMRAYSPVDLARYPDILAWLGRVGRREAYRVAMDKGDPGVDWKRGMSAEGHEVHGAWKEVLRRAGAVEVRKEQNL